MIECTHQFTIDSFCNLFAVPCTLYSVHTSATAPVCPRGSKRPSQGFWAEPCDLWRPEWGGGRGSHRPDKTEKKQKKEEPKKKKGKWWICWRCFCSGQDSGVSVSCLLTFWYWSLRALSINSILQFQCSTLFPVPIPCLVLRSYYHSQLPPPPRQPLCAPSLLAEVQFYLLYGVRSTYLPLPRGTW